MSFVAGRPIEEARNAPQDVRNQIARDLIDLTLRELFEFGLMQTDPNFANYLYDDESGRIALLDFGATRKVDKQVVAQYARLLVAGCEGDLTAIDEVIAEIGFVGPETAPSHRAQIVDMILTVFATMRGASEFDFADATLSRAMQTKGTALAEDGFIPPPLPIDVLLLQRKFGGVFLLAAKLNAKVDVMDVLELYLIGAAHEKRSA